MSLNGSAKRFRTSGGRAAPIDATFTAPDNYGQWVVPFSSSLLPNQNQSAKAPANFSTGVGERWAYVMSFDRTVAVGGVTIGLVGTGIVVLWPEKRWLGWVFIGLGLLTALLSIVWALAMRYARNEFETGRSSATIPTSPQQTQNTQINPNINITPVFAPSFNQSQSQTQYQEQIVTTRKAVQAEIECTDCYFADAYLSGWNKFTEHIVVDGRSERCKIVQADFYLKPIPGADPWIELRTQLLFYDVDGNSRLKRVSDGVWRESSETHIQMPINTSDTRRLVIAVALEKSGFNSYEYAVEHLRRRVYTIQGGVRTHTLSPKVQPLNVSAFTVQVILVGKYRDEVTLNQEFWFRVSFSEKEFAIKKIQSPRGIETDLKTQF